MSSLDPSSTKCLICEFENVGPFIVAWLLFPLKSNHVDPEPGYELELPASKWRINPSVTKSIDIILNHVTDAIKEGLSERQKEKEVAEVIKEKESGSEKKNEVSEDQKEDVKEVKEKKKRTRVAKKTE